MRCAFLFPGQGAQYVGMGRDLCDRWDAARRVYERADEALQIELSRICFEGPASELVKTVNAQPAILTHSVAAWALFAGEGPRPRGVAGHSVGEYAALVASGVLTFEDAIRLVRRRGELMYEVGLSRPGTMTAVVGLSEEEVSRVCEGVSDSGVVQIANLNSPGQVVISGTIPAVEKAELSAKEAGAKRVIRLDVSGAFHSALMEEASEGLREALAATTFSPAEAPVVTNVDGRALTDGARLRNALERQLTSPVRWVSCIQTLIDMGCDTFVELGPGKVLGGLLRRIDRERTVYSVGDVASVENLHDVLQSAEGAESCR